MNREKLHVRKNDIVTVRTGRDARKTGKVLQVLPERGRAIVEGINFVKKCMRKSQDNPKGKIIDKEAALAVSKLMLYCPHCKAGVRVTHVRDAENRRIRKCRKCSHAFDG